MSMSGPTRRPSTANETVPGLFIDAHLHRKVLGVIAGAIVVFIASTLAALLSYRFYESPFLRLKKYFTYRESAAAADRQAALHTT